MNVVCADPALRSIQDKLAGGERLDRADGQALLATTDLHALGRLAHQVRAARHGRFVYYNVNRHIHYTNVCRLRCRFCGFRRRLGAPDSYTRTIEEVVEQARQAADAGATEAHIVGGLHPKLPYAYYPDLLRAVRAACPRMCIKAFTAVEIAHMARLADKSVEGVLTELRAAGLDCLPGGGAEVFSGRVQAATFAGKLGADEWFAVHQAAHRLGIPSTATILYGHVETPAERVAHLLKLRDLQDRTGGFVGFVPLSFVPAGSDLADLPGPTAIDDLRMIAVGRLMLDNFPHIKTFWVMTGEKLSQIALLFGADDIDGTVGEYDITHRDGQGRDQRLTVERIESLIRAAGLTPVERDTLYRRVVREGGRWRIETASG